MNEEKKEIIEVLLANRLFLYSLLHSVFGREPDEELLEILTAENTGEAFALLSEESGDTMEKAGTFLAEVAGDMADPNFLSELKSEYMRLFVGPVKLVAPPWESVYRGKEAMLFQESTLQVREFYRSFGLQPEGYPHVADDSLALELGFMAKLAERCVKALADGDMAELKKNLIGSDEFLEDHMLIWIPKLLEKMADAQSDCLYPQMTLILDSFLRKDHALLISVLHEL